MVRERSLSYCSSVRLSGADRAKGLSVNIGKI